MDLYHRIKLRNLRVCGSGENSRSKAVTGSPLAALRAGRRWRENELKRIESFACSLDCGRNFCGRALRQTFHRQSLRLTFQAFTPRPPPARGRASTSNLNFSGLLRWPRTFTIVAPSHRTRQLQFFFFFRRSKLFPARAKLLPRPNCLGFTSSIHPPPSRSSSSEHGRIIEVIYQGELIADCRARLGWAGDDNSNFAFFFRDAAVVGDVVMAAYQLWLIRIFQKRELPTIAVKLLWRDASYSRSSFVWRFI